MSRESEQKAFLVPKARCLHCTSTRQFLSSKLFSMFLKTQRALDVKGCEVAGIHGYSPGGCLRRFSLESVRLLGFLWFVSCVKMIHGLGSLLYWKQPTVPLSVQVASSYAALPQSNRSRTQKGAQRRSLGVYRRQTTLGKDTVVRHK